MGFRKFADIPKEDADALTEVEAERVAAELNHLAKTSGRLTPAQMREEVQQNTNSQ